MKIIWITLLMLLPALFVSAQDTLKTDELPDEVLKNFERRNRNITVEVWLNIDDYYVARYENRRGYEESKYYNEDGHVIKTVQKQPLDNLRNTMEDYLKENYRKYKPYEMYFVEKGRRERYFSILMRHKKADDPPETEIQFDQAGRFIAVMNLYIPGEEKEDPEIDEDFAETVDSETHKLASEIVEKEVKKKNLPSKIIDYVDELYPYPFRMKSSYLLNSDDGPIYEIIMREQGQDHYFKLIFDINGEINSDEKIYD